MNDITFREEYMPVFKELALLEDEYKEIDARRKEVKKQLCEAMEKHGIKSVDNEYLKITYVAPTVTFSIDWKAYQLDEPKKFEKIQKKYTKESKRGSYVKVTTK